MNIFTLFPKRCCAVEAARVLVLMLLVVSASLPLRAQVSTLAGSGTLGTADGTGAAAQFNLPRNVAIDAAGNTYIADMLNHRIRMVTPGGVVTTIAGSTMGFMDGTGAGAQFNNPHDVAVDGSGNLYVADRFNNRIRKVVIATGVVTTFAGSGTAGWLDATGTAAQFNNPHGLCIDGSGNLYVADLTNPRIRKITPGGVVTTIAGNGTAGFADGLAASAQFNDPSDVAVDAAGNIYVADFSNRRVRKITPTGVVSTVAGTGGAGLVDGPAATAQFASIGSLCIDNLGSILLTDEGNHVIRRISPAGTVSTLAGTPPSGFTDGTFTAAKFWTPSGVAIDPTSGALLITDHNNHAIRKIVPVAPTVTSFLPTSAYPMQVVTITGTNFFGITQVQFGGVTSPWFEITSNTQIRAVVPVGAGAGNVTATNSAGTGSQAGFTVAVAPQVSTFAGEGITAVLEAAGQAARFNTLCGITRDASGNLYAVDIGDNRIYKVTPAGVVTVLAGAGSTGALVDGTGIAAKFNSPAGIGIDGSGNLYVGDYNNNAIRKITPAGVVTTFAGTGVAGFADGPGASAQFNKPDGIAVDGVGNVYVGDALNHRIRKITPGGIVSTLAGTGVAGFADGPGASAQFNEPIGLRLDALGNLYVADYSNNRIRKVTSLGVVSTIAGTGTAGFSDGPGASAQFNGPAFLSLDAAGNIYVADFSNHRIRFINTSNQVSTFTGTGTAAFTDGTTTAAQFNLPNDIIPDGSGSFYVTDRGNQRIRKITPIPTVTGFTATTGYPGLGIVINGTNFIGVTQVQFGGVASPSFTVISATQLVAAVPAGGASGSVSVTNSGGTGSLAGFTFTGTVPQVSTVVGNAAGAGLANGQNGAVRLNSPTSGLKIGGDIYFTDDNNHRVCKYTIATGVVTTVAGSGVAGYLDATGTAAQFNTPQGLTRDAAGDLYVSDAGNHRIRKIAVATGVVTTFAGSGVAGFNDATGTLAQFNSPAGMEWDGTYIYVCDLNNHRIRRIQIATGSVTTFAGSGTAGNADGIGAAAQFNRPYGLTSDGTTYLYVAGYYGHNIRRVSFTGNVVTIAGDPAGTAGFADGVGTAARFNYPTGIAWANGGIGGLLYIADAGNHAVRLLDIGMANTVNLYSGPPYTVTPGFIDGTLNAARYNTPTGIVFDAAGVFYVMDQLNNTIRRVSPAPPTISGFLPASAYPMQVVTITGTNLAGASQVQFGGVNAAWYAVDSPTQIRAVVPFGAVTGTISVTTPGGTATSGSSLTVTAVPQVSTVAGDGTAAYLDAVGQATQFNDPCMLARDVAGNIYVADRLGHRIRKISSTGVVTTIAGSGVAGGMNGIGIAAQFNNPYGILLNAAQTTLYVAEELGHRIRAIDLATGTVTTFAGSGTAGYLDATGVTAQFNRPIGMAIDGAGNLYVTEDFNHTVRQITSGGVVTTIAGSAGMTGFVNGVGAVARFNRPRGIVCDATGTLYVSDYSNNCIRKITPAGVVSTLAGNGGAGLVNGNGTSAQFNGPIQLWLDAQNNIYVADGFNNAVRMVSPSGTVMTVVGGGAGYTDGTLAAAQLQFTVGIVGDPATGILTVADEGNARIRRITPALPTISSFTPTSAYPMQVVTITGTDFLGITQVQFGGVNAAYFEVTSLTQIRAVVPFGAVGGNVTVTNLVGTALLGGFTVAPTPAISTFTGGSAGNLHAAGQASQINSPVGIAIDAGGNTYIAEVNNDIIRKITPAGVSSVFAGNGTGGAIINGTGTAAQFQDPHGMAIDGAGNLYVCDYNNHAIRKITPAGVVTTLAGNGAAGFNDATGAAAQFQAPIGIAYQAGFVYVSEDSGHRIRKVDVATGTVTTLAGDANASPASGTTDATGTAARFNSPRGLVLDGSGNVYVADHNNHRIRKITPAGVVTTLAGSTAGFANGMGAAAQFQQPRGITIDGSGNLYVTDAANSRIRNVSPGGNVTTLAGSGIGMADGTLLTGQFSNGTEGVAFTAAGDLYVVDRNFSRIRKVTLSGATYVWSGLPGADWTVAGNWSPARTSPVPSDVLQFNSGTHTPTNVPSESIKQLILAAGANVTLAAGSAQTLSAGVNGVQIPATASLDLGANVVLGQAAGGTITVDGTLNTNTSYVNGAGNLTFNANSTLATANNDGVNGTSAITGAVQMTGTITYNASTSYNFTATNTANRFMGFAAAPGKPAVTQCKDLTIGAGTFARTMDNNFTATGAITVNGILQTAALTLSLSGTGTLTVPSGGQMIASANGTITNSNSSGTSFIVQSGGYLGIQDNGQVSAASASDVSYIAGSTLEYFGTTTAKTTTAREIGAAGVQNLLVNNTQGVTLGANATVQQSLNVGSMSQLILSNVGNPTLTLNGTLNQNGSSNIASANTANAGSITLGGTNSLALILSPINNTLNNFTVNRSGSHTLTGDVNVRGTLTLTNGILVPSTYIFSGIPGGTAAGIITGGSTNSYIQGKLQRRFTGGIVAAGTSYDFPVGTSVGYRPATLVNVLTGASPVVQLENFDTGAMTYDVSLTALLSPRNWHAQLISGVFNGSALALTDAGTNAGNVVARSTAQAGMYQSFGGTAALPVITSNVAGAVPATLNHYFAIGSVQPFITMVSPSTVSPGDTVTLTGNQLGSVSAISFGGTAAASFQIISPTQIRAVVGSGSSGPITLIYPGGTAPSMQTTTFNNAPAITSFDPSYGTTGSTVRISGARLSNPTNVSFGGTNALSLRLIDANTLEATVGLGASGAVSVQTQAGSATSASNFDFIVKPSIVNFYPKWGRIADTVNIFGGNFQRVSSVRFGTSAPILNFTLVTSGQIRLRVPPDVATGMIRTTNPVGTDSSWTNFIYTAPPLLQSVFPNPIVPVGQAITLTGGEFHPVPRVMIGTTTAASVEWTNLTQIKATFAQATTGILTIYASGGNVSLATPVQVVLPPVITSFAPRYPSPGDRVTVTGANFFPGFISLSIGGVPVSGLAINSSTQLTFTVPPTVAGPLTITTPGGLSVVATGQTVNVVPQPQITGSSGITTATIGQSLILQGTGLMNIEAFTLGGVDVTNFAPIGTTGTLMQMTIPRLPGVDSAAAEIITTEATIALLTRSGFASYTLFVRNRSVSGTTGTSTNGTMQGGGISTLMRLTSVSPVVLPEGSSITLQGTNIATNATVWVGSGMNTQSTSLRRLTIESQSTTSIVVLIPDGFVPPLLLSTSASLVVSTPTLQIISPFAVQVLARVVPSLATFFPEKGSTRAIVSIVGENFAVQGDSVRGAVRGVSIGGVPVQAFRVVSPTLIQATVGAVQTGFVRVETASGLLQSRKVFTLDSAAAANAEPPEPVLSKDSLALNRFFAATQGMAWTTSTNWTNAAPIALRFGVKVRGGRVVELRLPNVGIQGTLLPDVFADLDALEVLDVSGNRMTGILPQEFALLLKLKTLRLQGNRFTGALPQGFCGMASLGELDLSGNALRDSLANLCCLSQIETLNLRGNSFVGTIPICIQNMTALSTLDLQGNGIGGTVPDAIGRLRSLRVVNLRGNRFTGAFPRALGQSFNNIVASGNPKASNGAALQEALGLETLDLGGNGFTGEIPDEIGNFPNVRTLRLERNNFTGSLPKSLLSLTRLRVLDVSNNQLTSGPDLNLIPRLDTLRVENNRFAVVALERFLGVKNYTYLPQVFPTARLLANGVNISTSTTLTVTVNEPLLLQVPRTENFSRTTWRKNGITLTTPLDTSRHADLRIPAFALSDTGVYECVLTNDRLEGVMLTTAQVRVSGRLPQVAPLLVALQEPRANEEDVPTEPRFVWTSSTGAETYRLQLAADADFAQVLASATIPQSAEILAAGTASATKQSFSNIFAGNFPLSQDRRYYWRVRAENNVGTSAWAVGTFTTVPPDVVLTISPLDLGRTARFDSVGGSITIRNFGTAPLTLESVSSTNAAFTLETVRTGTILPANGELRLLAYTKAQAVGNATSAITVRFRSGISSTVQERTMQNRLVVRVQAVKLVAPPLDTVVAGRRQLNSIQLLNLSDEPVTLRSAALQQLVAAYSLRPVQRDLDIAVGQSATLLLETQVPMRQTGAVPQETLRCITIRGEDVSTTNRTLYDTVQTSFRAVAREARREDVFIKVSVKALEDSVAPGGAVTLELALSPLPGSSFQQIVRSATPSFRGTLRWNPQVLALATGERGLRSVPMPIKPSSSNEAVLQQFTIPQNFWSGLTPMLLQVKAVGVAGNTDVTPIVLENLEWGGGVGTVYIDALENGTFTAKACKAGGGKRLVTSAKPTHLALIAPNPAKEQVNIAYTLREDGFTEIALIDANGKTVQILLAEEQTAGEYSITRALKGLPSGAYTMRLTTRGGVVSRGLNVVR